MALIEQDFPIEAINRLAREEAKGGVTRPSFEPLLYLHKWWARRLGCVFRSIILFALLDKNTKIREGNKFRKITPDEFNDPWSLYGKDISFGNKIVLDPFMGSGTTLIKALQMKCKVIGKDLNPISWLLVKKALEPLDVKKLQLGMNQLEERIKSEIKQYYYTECPSCLTKPSNLAPNDELLSNNPKNEPLAEVIYFFWIKEIECPQEDCKNRIKLLKSYMLAHKRLNGKTIGFYVFCPICLHLFEVNNYRKFAVCPSCEFIFNPSSGPVRKKGDKFFCNKCKKEEYIVKTIQKFGKANNKLIAVKYHCNLCKSVGYKQVDDFDHDQYFKAEKELNTVWPQWIGKVLPDTEIPMGFNTKQMINHGYLKWSDMFNARQLLNLAKLLFNILELNIDWKTKEFFLLIFSRTLEYQNMFCEYHRINNYIYNMFKTHAFHPTLNPVENNLWGAAIGFGTFSNFVKRTIKQKTYNFYPYLKYYNQKGSIEKKFTNNQIIGIFDNIFENPLANSYILQGDSRFLPIPDKSIDAVITDPPYFGNVMYSELSEFFYSWLRLCLKDHYNFFQSKHIQNFGEVIVNKFQGKKKKDYLELLYKIFIEINTKIKDDGLFIFTFHHQEISTWVGIVEVILKANFYISAIYPVHAEMITSTMHLNKKNVQFDMIFVCKKRLDTQKNIEWLLLKKLIREQTEEVINRLKNGKIIFSLQDSYFIVIGKALQLFSDYYPNIWDNKNQVTISEVLKYIISLIKT
ncbi:DNA methyltransferase [Candidatus Hodarchaeum mangrovi]